MIYNYSRFNNILNGLIFEQTKNYKLSPNNSETYEINQTKDGAYLLFEAPGFNKSNLKVEMEEGRLFISGERTYEVNGEKNKKTISKKFEVGEEYSKELIEATIEDGLLTVFIPNYKKQEKKRINLL